MNSLIWIITITTERWVFRVESVEMVVKFSMSSPKLLILSSSLGLFISEYITGPAYLNLELLQGLNWLVILCVLFSH